MLNKKKMERFTMDPATIVSLAAQAINAYSRIKAIAKKAQAENRKLTLAELDQIKQQRKVAVSGLNDAIDTALSEPSGDSTND